MFFCLCDIRGYPDTQMKSELNDMKLPFVAVSESKLLRVAEYIQMVNPVSDALAVSCKGQLPEWISENLREE